MKFNLRELFGVTLLVAVLCAWGLDHRRLQSRRDQLESEAILHKQARSIRAELDAAKIRLLEVEVARIARLSRRMEEVVETTPSEIPGRINFPFNKGSVPDSDQ